jgi:ribose/xylose/arabinose/galactoside ABC-type transport system permease subunit
VFWVKVIQGLIIMIAMFIDAQRVRYRTPTAESAGPAKAPEPS